MPPPLELFGRRCHVASDDLLLPAAIGAAVHTLWMALAAYLLVHRPAQCPSREWLGPYLALCLAAFIAETGLDVLMAFYSLRGSVADDTPRRPIAKVIYSLLAVVTLETVLHSFALAKFHDDTTVCPGSGAFTALLGVAIYAFLAAIFGMALLLVTQMVVGSSRKSIERIDNPRFWQFCLAPLLCFPLYLRRDGRRMRADSQRRGGSILGDIAQLFADLFGDVDLVPSDVLVGLMLVKEQQVRERHRARRLGHRHSTLERLDALAIINGLPLHRNWQMIVHFFPYAEAIYGFPLFMFAHFREGLRHLLCPCRTQPAETAVQAVRTYMDQGWSSNCLCCFPASCCYSQAREHADLVHVSTTNNLFKSPFMVCLDHTQRALVIAIRGTLSTTDLLVDLHFGQTDIAIPQENLGTFTAQTHTGILKTARNILAEIESLNIFQNLLLSHMSPYAEYRIVCTGHSLGGGVASLLAYLIKTSPRYTELSSRVYALSYSPPGCMITMEGQDYFRTFCTSIVLGNDVIPRLTPYTVHSLKEQVKAALAACHDRRKVDIIGSAMTNQALKLLRRLFGLPLRHDAGIDAVEVPIIDAEYELVWAQPTAFHSIIISQAMGVDHLPNRLADTFAALELLA
nr:hypothetical protein HK105_001645 [Polyrhizophydium stewartii]